MPSIASHSQGSSCSSPYQPLPLLMLRETGSFVPLKLLRTGSPSTRAASSPGLSSRSWLELGLVEQKPSSSWSHCRPPSVPSVLGLLGWTLNFC